MELIRNVQMVHYFIIDMQAPVTRNTSVQCLLYVNKANKLISLIVLHLQLPSASTPLPQLSTSLNFKVRGLLKFLLDQRGIVKLWLDKMVELCILILIYFTPSAALPNKDVQGQPEGTGEGPSSPAICFRSWASEITHGKHGDNRGNQTCLVSLNVNLMNGLLLHAFLKKEFNHSHCWLVKIPQHYCHSRHCRSHSIITVILSSGKHNKIAGQFYYRSALILGQTSQLDLMR